MDGELPWSVHRVLPQQEVLVLGGSDLRGPRRDLWYLGWSGSRGQRVTVVQVLYTYDYGGSGAGPAEGRDPYEHK